MLMIQRALAIFVCLSLLTACARPASRPPIVAPESVPVAAPSDVIAKPAASSFVEDVDGWLHDLDAIDRRIVGRHSRALMLGRGHNVCEDIRRGVTGAKLIDNVNQRFTSPEAPNGFGAQVATRILATIRARLCP